ncbi:conserved protein, unknown function [Hepatocystis sp. ex Piliocolobus tephrosceles]|nr:conserved protein, unknown function [Hepatocystis sp. ex Piliocolobus tephrosceles]
MEFLLLEEKYKNIVDKSNYENMILKRETECLQKKIKNLEDVYIEKENKIMEILEEKEDLKDHIFEIENENSKLRDNIAKLNERILDLTDVCKTYRHMIKTRNKELQQSDILIIENKNLRNIIEDMKNHKLLLESKITKKNKIIDVIKEKYQKNISRILEKFNEKDKCINEFRSYVIHELNGFKMELLQETDNTCGNKNVQDNKILNICSYLDMLTEKIEKNMIIQVMK